MGLSEAWTIGWVPTNTIAKLCPPEYMAWVLMRQKYKNLTRHKIVEWIMWDNDYADNEIREILKYSGGLSFDEIKKEIHQKYHNLVRAIQEKTGLEFEMFHEAESIQIISSPSFANEKEQYAKLLDIQEDIWTFDYSDSDTLKKDLDITLVMCSY